MDGVESIEFGIFGSSEISSNINPKMLKIIDKLFS